MKQFIHPSKEDITLQGILMALADPMRLKIYKKLLGEDGCQSCTDAAPCPDMAKSTLSNHFRVLREAGLIRTEKRGVENRNEIREDVNKLFPGLVKSIMKCAA